VELKELARQLSDLVWAREQQTQQPMEAAILGYVQDAVTAEIEHRRRLRDLDRRLVELGVIAPA
jgi:hypothetical protein